MAIGDRAIWCLMAAFVLMVPRPLRAGDSWNRRTAAAYLDQRSDWWIHWPEAARDHDTFCVSCHTAVPYALARPRLRRALGESKPSTDEIKILDNVTRRVRLWKEVGTFYNDEGDGVNKTAESRGTESVLNALILANDDALTGHISPDTRAAFENMWELQRATGDEAGSWSWLQFDHEPWEGHDSAYYGAALAAVAVGLEPGNYRSSTVIQPRLKRLRKYLVRQYSRQSPINHAVLLWAAGRWTDLLTTEQRDRIIRELTSKQQADGGWGLAPLSWTWKDWTISSLARLWLYADATSADTRSDGYATALIVLALEQAGLRPENTAVRRGLAWLVNSQDQRTGRWPSYSLNGHRDHSTGVGLFMNDAATAYAVLALERVR